MARIPMKAARAEEPRETKPRERSVKSWADLSWGQQRGHVEQLAQKFDDALERPQKRSVRSSSGELQFVEDRPEDVARRHLWAAIRHHGGEPGGWDVELHLAGDDELCLARLDAVLDPMPLTSDELLCRAPDGQLVSAMAALVHHFRVVEAIPIENRPVLEAPPPLEAPPRPTRAEIAAAEREAMSQALAGLDPGELAEAGLEIDAVFAELDGEDEP